jgi:hypothetical protein
MNMNTPEGYVSLGLVGFTDKGDYQDTETYVKNDLVHYDNAIWQCLMDDSIGVNPRSVDTGHWKLWIDSENDASGITVVDTEGILTEKGKATALQAFIDAVADRVMNKLLTKAGLVNNGLATEAGVAALDAVMGKTLLDKIGDTANLPNGAEDIVSALVAQNSNLLNKSSVKLMFGANEYSSPVIQYGYYQLTGLSSTSGSVTIPVEYKMDRPLFVMLHDFAMFPNGQRAARAYKDPFTDGGIQVYYYSVNKDDLWVQYLIFGYND